MAWIWAKLLFYGAPFWAVGLMYAHGSMKKGLYVDIIPRDRWLVHDCYVIPVTWKVMAGSS